MHAPADRNGEEETGRLNPALMLRALASRWRLVLAVAAGVTLVGLVVALMLPTRYEATATVQIDPRKRTVLPLENVMSDLRPDAATVESEVEVLRSRALALVVIDRLRLREHPDFNQPGLLARLLGQGRAAAPATQKPNGPVAAGSPDEIVEGFAKRLKVGRVRNSYVIEIRVSAGEAALAAQIANALVAAYLADQIEAKREATRMTARQLHDRLEGLKADLAAAEQRVADFKARHGIVDAEGQLLHEKQLARHMEQTILARNQAAEARARYEQLQRLLAAGRSKAGIADVLQSHTVRMLKDQLGKATRRAAELSTRYGPRHPVLVKVRAEVADAEAQIAREVDQIAANLANEMQVAEARERSLIEGLAALKANQATTQAATVRLRELERDAATSRQLVEAVLARYKQATETIDLQTADARVIEHADTPSQPAAPKRRQIAAVGVVLGIALGAGLALLLEMMTPAILRREDAERRIGLPLIAALPSEPLVRLTGEATVASLRATLSEPQGALAEAVRAAALELDAIWNSSEPRLVLVASALAVEGATLAASNLAHHLALTGRRTLLVDADLRARRLSIDLGIGDRPGIIEALREGTGLETAILLERASGLAVLPAGLRGPDHGSPADLIQRGRLAARLRALKARFEVVIVDAPPLLPVVDARMLAGVADQIVMVSRARSTPVEITQQAMRALGRDGERLAGLILTGADGDGGAAFPVRADWPRVAAARVA